VVATRTLLAERTLPFLGELSWRIGLALAAINLVLIGLAVSRVNPRVGRNGNMIFSLFTFILYYNLITLGVSRIAAGTSDMLRFMLGLHGGIFLLTALVLAKLHWNWTLLSGLRRRRAARSDGTAP
jgi:lipopolysaccharide export system permease protein